MTPQPVPSSLTMKKINLILLKLFHFNGEYASPTNLSNNNHKED